MCQRRASISGSVAAARSRTSRTRSSFAISRYRTPHSLSFDDTGGVTVMFCWSVVGPGGRRTCSGRTCRRSKKCVGRHRSPVHSLRLSAKRVERWSETASKTKELETAS